MKFDVLDGFTVHTRPMDGFLRSGSARPISEAVVRTDSLIPAVPHADSVLQRRAVEQYRQLVTQCPMQHPTVTPHVLFTEQGDTSAARAANRATVAFIADMALVRLYRVRLAYALCPMPIPFSSGGLSSSTGSSSRDARCSIRPLRRTGCSPSRRSPMMRSGLWLVPGRVARPPRVPKGSATQPIWASLGAISSPYRVTQPAGSGFPGNGPTLSRSKPSFA